MTQTQPQNQTQNQSQQTQNQRGGRTRAALVLDNGTEFQGFLFGAEPSGDVAGEVEFTTDMFGYERQLCLPDHSGKIVVFAAPQIGNVGWTGEGAGDGDTDIKASAVVIRDRSRIASNQKAQRTLEEELTAQNITGLWGVDTRSLVRVLAKAARNGETVRAQIIVNKQEA